MERCQEKIRNVHACFIDFEKKSYGRFLKRGNMVDLRKETRTQ